MQERRHWAGAAGGRDDAAGRASCPRQAGSRLRLGCPGSVARIGPVAQAACAPERTGMRTSHAQPCPGWGYRGSGRGQSGLHPGCNQHARSGVGAGHTLNCAAIASLISIRDSLGFCPCACTPWRCSRRVGSAQVGSAEELVDLQPATLVSQPGPRRQCIGTQKSLRCVYGWFSRTFSEPAPISGRSASLTRLERALKGAKKPCVTKLRHSLANTERRPAAPSSDSSKGASADRISMARVCYGIVPQAAQGAVVVVTENRDLHNRKRRAPVLVS